MKLKFVLALLLLGLASPAVVAQQGYSSPIRVLAPITPRCINAETDQVTVTLRRILTQKYGGFFTQESRAGITVMATLNGSGNEVAKTPSVNQVDIKAEKKGQVSLALEYPVADLLLLKQGNTLTKNIQLDLFMAKTRGKSSFGNVLDIAAKTLAKLPIPSNPYTTAANQFLKFANQSIEDQTGPQAAMAFASITLAFTNQDQKDINACLNDGFQATGAIAVFRDTGPKDAQLLPVVNLNQQYCFRYTSQFTYELQYLTRPPSGCTNLPENAWQEVPNDYVMLIVSAQRPPSSQTKGVDIDSFGGKSAWDLQRRLDVQESKKLCELMGLLPKNCGIRGNT